VYGYLPPQIKRIVDEIVDELSRDKRVASAYALWQEMQDEVCRTYSEELPERRPLSQQKEFKPVRNMVIREALKLSEQTLGEDMPAAEMKQKAEPQAETETPEKRAEASQEQPFPTSERKHAEYDTPTPVSSVVVRMLHHMSRIFRENATADATHRGMQIDRKRRRQLQEKRIAMGHKSDDHEEQQRMQ